MYIPSYKTIRLVALGSRKHNNNVEIISNPIPNIVLSSSQNMKHLDFPKHITKT